MSNPKTLTVPSGIPAACNQHPLPAEPDASLRGQRPEKHPRFNRAVIPTRIAHPKRSASFGRLTVTGDTSLGTTARCLQPVAADAGGDMRGFVLKFSAQLPR